MGTGNHMERWNRLAEPPKGALKTIGGGRLKGLTDINPQWRYRAMTEVYGPCGVGWCWTIEKLWVQEVSEGQIAAFVQVAVRTRGPDGEWSEGIPGVGGSMLVAKEKSGLYSSDEAFKMATTDALSAALKLLGVGSAIYEGRWDGSKYRPAASGTTRPPAGGARPAGPTDTRTAPSRAVPEWKIPTTWDAEAPPGSPIYTPEEVLGWRLRVIERKWPELGYTKAQIEKAAMDDNALPVTCPICRGCCWTRHEKASDRAPEFKCMGKTKETQCKDGVWWPGKDGNPGQWYSRTEGGFPYRIPTGEE